MMLRRLPVSLVTLLLAPFAIACGGESSSGDNSAGEGNGSDSGAMADNPCGLHTNYDGDENCILPPAPDEGLQIHAGPSSYDDPDVINAVDEDGNYLWLMMPGDEKTQCYHTYSPNDAGVYYFKQQYRMRTGSHHMIIKTSTNTAEEGWSRLSGGTLAPKRCDPGITSAIGGTQHVVEDLPPGGIVAPEDEGLGRGMEPHTALDISLHFYNTSDEPRLREIWVNFLYKPKAEVITNLGMLGGFAPMNVAPGETASTQAVCKAEQFIPAGPEVRVVTLFGHAHTHNTRFAVYKEKQDGSSSDLVYDSYDGAEAPTYTYNTKVELPTADPTAHLSGGKSGLLTLVPGDQLRFVCDIKNDTEFTFIGQNEVNTDEMCNLFGSVAGLGFPCFALSAATPPPPPAMP